MARPGFRVLASALILCSPSVAQVFSMSAPKAAILYGENMTLTPVLRDPAGALLDIKDWVWTALDPAVLTIDSSGKITGKALGVGRIKLESAGTAKGLFGALQIQVQPKDITVTPAISTITSGGTVAYKAVATDINGTLIAGIKFGWFVTGETGRSDIVPATTSIDANGIFRGTDPGHYTVHAIIDYLPVIQGLPSHFEGTAEVDAIVPAVFQTDRMLSSDPIPATKLLASPGVFVASAQGVIAFTASADGISTAVMQVTNGQTRALITSGTPSPQVGSVVAGFQSVAMNSSGDSLISIRRGDSANGALMSSTAVGTRFVLLDNSSGVESDGSLDYELSYFSITPYCLNDNGTAVVRALYRPAGGTAADFRDGLFLIRGALSPGANPILLWSADKSLPGVPSIF